VAFFDMTRDPSRGLDGPAGSPPALLIGIRIKLEEGRDGYPTPLTKPHHLIAEATAFEGTRGTPAEQRQTIGPYRTGC